MGGVTQSSQPGGRLKYLRAGRQNAGDVETNLTILNQDAQGIVQQLLNTENDAAALYNLFASTQNSTRQMIRERLYQPSQRLYSEEFINSKRLDPSTTANIDYNAGLATPPLSSSAAVTPDSANIGVASIGSSTTDISLLMDGLPQTAFVWTGSQVELVFTFDPPQIVNRVTISLPAHQGISLVEFTSTPDGVLKEDLAADLPPENLSIDGSAGKYSGDWIAAEYKGDIFAAEHGSWNRAVRSGYEVVRVPLKNGKASGVYEDFLTGFVLENGEVWGRPVGVAAASDGSLLVSDDGSGSIWRVGVEAPAKQK